MYLYLGGDTAVKAENIIGIFDMDTSTVNKATRDYLSRAENEKRMAYVNYELPKSFVVCSEKIYVCPLNTTTLLKRVNK